jgi:hypothetical protein
MKDNERPRAWKHANEKPAHSEKHLLSSESKSMSVPVEPHAKVSAIDAQVTAAKLALDAARRIGDTLKMDLAESTLNDLLDRYHTYHTQQRREQ